MKSRFISHCGLLAIVFGLALDRSASADINGFGDFSGFTISQTDAGPAPVTSPGAVHITTTSANESRKVTYNTAQDISQFAASWNFGATNIEEALGGSAGDYEKFTLTTATGHVDVIFEATGANGSYATEVDWASQSVPLTHNFIATGKMPIGITNVGAFPHITLVPISQTPFTGSGNLFTSDTSISGSSSIFNLPAFPGILGAGPATLSFSAVTDGLGADQTISSFQFSNVPEPSSAALIGLCAGLAVRRTRRRI